MSVGVHSDVERVSSNNLVKMGREQHSRVDNRVDTVDGQLGACKSQHGLGGGILREQRDGGEGCQLHLGRVLTYR